MNRGTRHGHLQDPMVRPLGAQTGIDHAAAMRRRARNGGGLYEADLGGGLLKKRIARPGQGKSGGFRTLVATNNGNRWIFVFGFPKNERSNIDKDEAEALKKLADHLLSLTAQALDKAQRAGELMEVTDDA